MTPRLRGMAFAFLAATGGACFDDSVAGPGPGTDVRITYVGSPVLDSVGASVTGIRFLVTEAGSEDRGLADLPTAFAPQGEGCGDAETPAARTDSDGFVQTTWRLGDVAGECTLRVRVLNASGLLLEVADLVGEAVHGQATTLLWLAEGESVAARGSLGLTGPDGEAFDRLANEAPWRFRVVSGPVQRLGVAFGSEGGRTLVATGPSGVGRVAVETRWGDAMILDLCVTAGAPASEVRLEWTPAGAAPSACSG